MTDDYRHPVTIGTCDPKKIKIDSLGVGTTPIPSEAILLVISVDG